MRLPQTGRVNPIAEWVDAPPPVIQKKYGTKNGWAMMAIGALMTRPGQWARLAHRPFQIGSSSKVFKSYGCEYAARQDPDGFVAVYARYVGTAA